MPPQRKSASTAEQQLVKSNLPPQSKKKKAVALSQKAIPSHPQSLHLLHKKTFQQSCRVPEHSIRDKAALKRTRSSFWPFSKL